LDHPEFKAISAFESVDASGIALVAFSESGEMTEGYIPPEKRGGEQWNFCIEISPNDEQSYEAMREREMNDVGQGVSISQHGGIGHEMGKTMARAGASPKSAATDRTRTGRNRAEPGKGHHSIAGAVCLRHHGSSGPRPFLLLNVNGIMKIPNPIRRSGAGSRRWPVPRRNYFWRNRTEKKLGPKLPGDRPPNLSSRRQRHKGTFTDSVLSISAFADWEKVRKGCR